MFGQSELARPQASEENSEEKMSTIVEVKTQLELDVLPDRFNDYTIIRIVAKERIMVTKARENSSVVAWGNSSVVAWGNSSVEAWGNSSVVARENSSVEARGNSSVEAWENSSVVAWGNSSVEARENSSVVAWENSSVVAWGNSSVEAWENSSVVARGNSSVVAWGNVGVQLRSDFCTVTLFAFAVCWALANGKIQKKSNTATVIIPTQPKGVDGWLQSQAVAIEKGHVILFKRVSEDWKTQEGTQNETIWPIGHSISHPKWDPTGFECGEGKFHACSRPYFCDEFRSTKGDKYIAIRISVKDLHAWPNPDYPHKIAFKAGEVLYEVDRFGKKKGKGRK
jgi:hypothetical protein